jgi:Carboxypeptidase regulatory-like domain
MVVAIRSRPELLVVAMMLVFCSAFTALGQTQAPPTAPPPAPESPQSSESSSKKKYSHVHDYLIRGTVFTDTALALPGARLRIRRAGEKKFHWEGLTNSRGEFAVRVPQGSDYELSIEAKGFAEETRSFDAKSGISESTMTVQMKKAVRGKS